MLYTPYTLYSIHCSLSVLYTVYAIHRILRMLYAVHRYTTYAALLSQKCRSSGGDISADADAAENCASMRVKQMTDPAIMEEK